jgi:hypothetical protein
MGQALCDILKEFKPELKKKKKLHQFQVGGTLCMRDRPFVQHWKCWVRRGIRRESRQPGWDSQGGGAAAGV